MSPTPDSTLADPQQVIAELQRRLYERTAERDEALARETSTAEVLQVINASPGDLAPVFDAMLEKAHAFAGLTSAACKFTKARYPARSQPAASPKSTPTGYGKGSVQTSLRTFAQRRSTLGRFIARRREVRS